LIDFGDAGIGVPDYESVPLCLETIQRRRLGKAFLGIYDPPLHPNERLGQRVAPCTPLHHFGTDAIAKLPDMSGAVRSCHHHRKL